MLQLAMVEMVAHLYIAKNSNHLVVQTVELVAVVAM
jgi:hypothetical protein